MLPNSGAAGRRRGSSRLALRPRAGALVCTLALAVVAFLVLYPLWLLLLNSFQVGVAGTSATWGLANWRAAFVEPTLWSSVVNTVALAATRQALALVIGVPVAWLIARTDLPGRHWLEFGFWVAVFLPSLTVVVGLPLRRLQRPGQQGAGAAAVRGEGAVRRLLLVGYRPRPPAGRDAGHQDHVPRAVVPQPRRLAGGGPPAPPARARSPPWSACPCRCSCQPSWWPRSWA